VICLREVGCFWESALFFISLCTHYMAVFHMYVKLYFIFPFIDRGKFTYYVCCIVSYTGVPRLLFIRQLLFP
jgi:hypothetical protein